MSILYVLVPLALVVVLVAVIAYVWAARHGQFDDLDTPALRAIQDDPERSAASSMGGNPGPDDPRPVADVRPPAASAAGRVTRRSERRLGSAPGPKAWIDET